MWSQGKLTLWTETNSPCRGSRSIKPPWFHHTRCYRSFPCISWTQHKRSTLTAQHPKNKKRTCNRKVISRWCRSCPPRGVSVRIRLLAIWSHNVLRKQLTVQFPPQSSIQLKPTALSCSTSIFWSSIERCQSPQWSLTARLSGLWLWKSRLTFRRRIPSRILRSTTWSRFRRSERRWTSSRSQRILWLSTCRSLAEGRNSSRRQAARTKLGWCRQLVYLPAISRRCNCCKIKALHLVWLL